MGPVEGLAGLFYFCANAAGYSRRHAVPDQRRLTRMDSMPTGPNVAAGRLAQFAWGWWWHWQVANCVGDANLSGYRRYLLVERAD